VTDVEDDVRTVARRFTEIQLELLDTLQNQLKDLLTQPLS
jgi:hypothetical protein